MSAKNPWMLIFFFLLSLKGGGERAKINYFSLELGLFGECRELQVPGLCQQQSNEVTSRLTLGSPSSPSTLWMFILCSHLDLLLCGISSHFRVCSRQFQGQIREYWGVQVILTHLLTPGTKNWCSGSHKSIPLFPLSGNHPALNPKRSSQELKALLHCKMNPKSTDMQCVPC